MNLILIRADEVDDNGSVLLSDYRARHIHEVLKGQPGKPLKVGLLNGPFGVGTIRSIDHASVELLCVWDEEPPQPPTVDLLLALPRPKVLRRLWAQLSALGVGRIILTNAEKVERYYFDSHVLDQEVYERLLVEGLQQARDTLLPEVSIHRRLKVLLEDDLDSLSTATTRLMAHPSGSSSIPKSEGRVLLAVGPEGGWSEYETKLLSTHGFHSFSMGPRILRSDTACIAALSQISSGIGC